MSSSYWESCYRSGRVAWDPGPYDGNLPSVLEDFHIPPCRLIDIGCGTGSTLIWLAGRGYTCTGVDLAPSAIRAAEKNSQKRQVKVRWICGEFPGMIPDTGTFELALDRGCLQHLIHSSRTCREYVSGIAEILEAGGLWYSLTACTSGGPHFGGPPRWSEVDIRQAVEPYFEILSLQESVFTPGEAGSIPAWICVGRKRESMVVPEILRKG